MSLTNEEVAFINQNINVSRVLEDLKFFSEDVISLLPVPNPPTGRGTAATGTQNENALADIVAQKLAEIVGVDNVEKDPFTVMTYEYDDFDLKVGGEHVKAIALHGAGGTYGVRNDNVFPLNGKKRIKGPLYDLGLGRKADYDNFRASHPDGVKGAVVLIKRVGWPLHEISQAVEEGAIAMIISGYAPSSEEEVDKNLIRQDSVYDHTEIPALAISENTATLLKEKIGAKVSIKLKLDLGDGISYNVIAHIKGNNVPATAPYIILSAHYDRWGVGTADNMSGLVAMFELGRLLQAMKSSLKKNIILIATGSEEAGHSTSTDDWLAGALAFVKQNPSIWRRTIFALNFDIYGWTNDETNHSATAELLPFLINAVEVAKESFQLQTPITVSEYNTSLFDAWVYKTYAGAGVLFQSSARIFGSGPGSTSIPFSRFYHTNGDIYDPSRFLLLEQELKTNATTLILANKRLSVPLQLGMIATSLSSLTGTLQDIDYTEVQKEINRFSTAIAVLESYRDGTGNTKISDSILLNVRFEFTPWLYASTGYRLTLYNRLYSSISTVLSSLKNGVSSSVILSQITRVNGAGWWPISTAQTPLFSPSVVERERLSYYGEGGWSEGFDQRAVLVGEDLNKVYYGIRDGTMTYDQAEILVESLRSHILVELKEALFITEGKLRQATAYIYQFLK